MWPRSLHSFFYYRLRFFRSFSNVTGRQKPTRRILSEHVMIVTGLLGVKVWRPTHSLRLQVGQSCRGPLCPAASAGQLSGLSADPLGL